MESQKQLVLHLKLEQWPFEWRCRYSWKKYCWTLKKKVLICRSYNVWCPMSVYYKPRIGCLSLITIWQIRPSFFEIQIMMSKSAQCLMKSVNMAWQLYKLSWSCKAVVFLQYLAYKYNFWYFRVILYSSCNFSWESKQRANCL